MAGQHAGFPENDIDPLGKVGAPQLPRRYVDRQAERLESPGDPEDHLLARFAQHPVADRVDDAGLLRDRDELGGRDDAHLRMVPAQQHLQALDPAGRDVDARLKAEMELVALDRLAQPVPQVQRLDRDREELGRVELVGVPARVLGAPGRRFGAAQQLVRVVAVLREDAHADADGHIVSSPA